MKGKKASLTDGNGINANGFLSEITIFPSCRMARVIRFNKQANRNQRAERAWLHVQVLFESMGVCPADKDFCMFSFSKVHCLNDVVYFRFATGTLSGSSFSKIFHKLSC